MKEGDILNPVDGSKVIESLQVIQDVCKYYIEVEHSCENCPFYVNQSELCGVADCTPDNWRILEYTKFQALG